MPTITGNNGLRVDRTPWQVRVAQLLEESHLEAWSGEALSRARFATGLIDFLRLMPDTRVCVLHGSHIQDLYSFCTQLEVGLGSSRIKRRIDAPGGVIDALRRRWTPTGKRPIRRRYFVWKDADALLRHDHRLFGKLVDAITGVAAEAEYVSEDMLLLQRAVFVGGAALDVYAEDESGQFCRWLEEAKGAPFWEVMTGVKKPPVVRYRIEAAISEGLET